MDQENYNLKSQNHLTLHSGKVPSILSIDPGKTIVLQFIKPKSDLKEPPIEVKCKKNIFNREKQADIFIENLDESKGMVTGIAYFSKNLQSVSEPMIIIIGTKLEKDIKDPPEVPKKEMMYSNVDVFPSIGEDAPPEPLNFKWDMDSMNQEINPPSNYLKPEVQSGKYINLEQSNISHMMESAEGCGDFDMSKPLLSITNEQVRNYQMGGTSILNQFCSNVTPIFSINEDMGDNVRPNILESVISQDNLPVVTGNLPPFVMNPNEDMMMNEEF